MSTIVREDADERPAEPLETEQARQVLDALTRKASIRGGSPVGGAGGTQERIRPACPTKEGLPDPDQGPLGNHANNFSGREQTPSSDGESLKRTRRAERYEDRRVLRGISSLERVQKCGKVTHDEQGAALVLNGGVAHWSGFVTCGSVWDCPVCNAKIMATRAEWIGHVVAKHMLSGGNAWMNTLTARHKRHHPLAYTFDAVAKSWPKLMGGTAWAGDKRYGTIGEKDRLGVDGWIRTMEVTYGIRNGWHPHLHTVLLTRDEGAVDLARAMGRWRTTWKSQMAKYDLEPNDQHGVDWQPVTTAEKAGDYIAKVGDGGKHIGNEMARGDLKKGRFRTMTYFEILRYFRLTGDAAAIPLIHEYEKATHRRRAITKSKGLAEKYGMEPEKTDEEIAEEEIGGEKKLIVPGDSRKWLVNTPYMFTHVMELLEVGGMPALIQFFTEMHLAYGLPNDES